MSHIGGDPGRDFADRFTVLEKISDILRVNRIASTSSY